MTITGTTGNDVLQGTTDDDFIDGLGGIDTVSYATSYADIRWFINENGVVINTRSGGEGADTLVSVEAVSFGDGVTMTIGTNVAGGTTTVTRDTGSIYQWDNIRVWADEDGRATFALNTFDDGTTSQTSNAYHDNGRIALRVQTDGDSGMSDRQVWDERISRFDTNGRLESVETTLDAGPTLTILYDRGQNGRVQQRTDVDGELDAQGNVVVGTTGRDWASRDYEYDSVGRLESYTVRFDDGTVMTDDRTYSNETGRMETRIMRDGEPGADPVGSASSGRALWAERMFEYNEDGYISSIETLYDNGRSRTSAYLYNQDSLMFRVDYDGRYDEDAGWVDGWLAWETRLTQFDGNGQVVSSTLVNDNEDTIADTFVNGSLTERVITDVSDTRAWDTRTQTFDQNGTSSDFVYTWDDGVNV